jgi:hypothetical protein
LVIDHLVIGDVEFAMPVNRVAIGHQPRLFGDVLIYDLFDPYFADFINLERADLSASLHKADNGHLVLNARFHALAFLTSDVGFVGFNDTAIGPQGLNADDAHCFADTVRHEPSGFKRDAQGAGKLVAADALFAGAKQKHRLEPQIHRDVAILENGANLHGELLAALVALPKPNAGRFAAHLADAVKAAAMPANGAFRPHAGLNPSDSGCFVLQDFGGKD